MNRLLEVLLLCALFNLWHCMLSLSDQVNYFLCFQMGTFKAQDGEYFLEPIMKADGSEHEDDHNKPHLIYRQELKSNYFLQSHKPCEVSGKLRSKTFLVESYYLNISVGVIIDVSSLNIEV